MQCDGGKGWSTNNDSTKRRLRCPIAPIILDLAEPRDAQFVMARLFWSGTTRGEPRLFQKCVDRFRARSESDRNWVGWLQIAFDQPPENRARAL